MKQFTILILAIFSFATLHAQEPTTVYCSIAGSQLAGRVNGYIGPVEVNIGENSSKKRYLVDDDGKRINFNTMIEALNHMAKRGWRLESTYTIYSPSITENSNLDEEVIVMILSKEVNSEEVLTQGL